MMTVIEFKNKWQLTYWQLAGVLGLSECTCKAYCFSPNAVKRLEPPESVLLHIQHLDELWTLKGRKPGEKMAFKLCA